jgi:hypothetical protein
LGMIAYACNTSTWEEGEARLWASLLHSEALLHVHRFGMK